MMKALTRSYYMKCDHHIIMHFWMAPKLTQDLKLKIASAIRTRFQLAGGSMGVALLFRTPKSTLAEAS